MHDLISQVQVDSYTLHADGWVLTNSSFGTYTSANGYKWLLDSSISPMRETSWTWFWRFKISEKVRVLLWLILHGVLRSNYSWYLHGLSINACCSHCGGDNESTIHILCNCPLSLDIWSQLDFVASQVFFIQDSPSWIKFWPFSSSASLFFATVWVLWRWRN